MSATTRWWFCGDCGFANHPRKGQDNKKCEQCGHAQDDPRPEAKEAVDNDEDYTPTGGR